MRERKGIFQNVDWILIGLFFLLAFMGWLNIYAATYNESHQSIFDFSQSYGKQLVWIGTGVFLATIILMLEETFFKHFSYIIYLFGLLLLVVVLFLGKEINGNKSWFVIGGFISFQPAEIAKFGTSLAIASFIGGGGVKFKQLKSQLIATAIIGAPILLILLQPDVGSTLVFLSFVFVLYREGLSGNILLIGLGAIVLFVVTILVRSSAIELTPELVIGGKYILIFGMFILATLLYYGIKKMKYAFVLVYGILIVCVGYVFSINYIFENILKRHHRNRINDLLGITFDPHGAGYNVHQSKIAIGSGGFTGKGFLQGTQTKFDFVPEQSTDFIFCTVGEEWGFIGTFTVISLFLFLIFRIIFIAERQKSVFSRVFCYSTASIFFIHFLINIGMTIGLAPVIGIPLPFFSYGGSSLWSFTVFLFTVIRLDSERKVMLG